MRRIPLLVLSDAVASTSGLSRIARELAVRIHEHLPHVFKVGTFGMGATYSAKFPFANYPVTRISPQYATIPDELPTVWRDFAGDERGVLLCIWNTSWLEWLSDPDSIPAQYDNLKKFLLTDPFDKWGYFPQDGHCANGLLPESQTKIIKSFDRILGYTEYGANLMQRSIYSQGRVGDPIVEIPHLPHGLDTSIFYPRDRAIARKHFAKRIIPEAPDLPILPNALMLGINATCTPRKDWHLAFEVAAELRTRGHNVGIWAHTNTARSYWDIPDLARIFGVADRMMLTTNSLTDDQLAYSYSAMDVILSIGAGEGWGYINTEGLACGVPVIAGNYAASGEILPKEMLVEPVIFRGEATYSIQRPVFRAADWADAVERNLDTKPTLPSYIDWTNAWLEWSRWLEAGVK